MSGLNIRKDSCELDFLALGALVLTGALTRRMARVPG